MKIKIGYHRLKNGIFINSNNTIKIHELYKYNKEVIIKVANTAQELIQVGDLVTYDTGITNDTFIVTENVSEWIKGKGICIHKQWIIRILTPNKDTTVYTLQWEAKS